MLHKIALLSALMITVTPACAADYLVFQKGQTKSNEIWQGAEPVPGANVPMDATVKLWEPVDGDRNLDHYIFDGKDILMNVTETPTVSMPNADGFFSEILQSGMFTDGDMLKMLIVERERNVEKRNALILQLLQGREPELIGKLLEVAAKHNIQLPTPK